MILPSTLSGRGVEFVAEEILQIFLLIGLTRQSDVSKNEPVEHAVRQDFFQERPKPCFTANEVPGFRFPCSQGMLNGMNDNVGLDARSGGPLCRGTVSVECGAVEFEGPGRIVPR
jgi:hypothetical protein